MSLLIHQTRESWLEAAASGLEPWFVDAGKPVTVPYRVAMGFPSTRALSTSKRRVGECWSVEASADGHAEILISPLMDDPVEIVGIVCHELAHATLGGKVGHRAPFARLVASMGLEGKPTATYVGDAFRGHVTPLMALLGPLPHGRLSPTGRPVKKDGVRQLKCECGTCGYIARTTQKWIDLGGPPICPIDREPMVAA